MFIVEAGFTAILLTLALAAPHFAPLRLRRVRQLFTRLARRRWLAVLSVTASALLLRLVLLPVFPVPQPFVHDEFSYLLAGETFASGRLTNPTHPLWMHFESFHISHWPSYMSMYFPGQGVMLAAGKLLFGHPWFGVWLTTGLMCGAICWMLQAWLPPVWALGGGMIAVMRLGIFSYWMNSYWGGSLAALGGALVLGALPRLMRRPRAASALVLGCGFAILAVTRPYEGLWLSLPVIFVLGQAAWEAAAGRGPAPQMKLAFLGQVAAPLAAVLLAMGYYNWRVFGSPWTLPYQINRNTYAQAQVFLWQKPHPEPPYRHKEFRDFYVSMELAEFQETRTVRGYLNGIAKKFGIMAFFFFGIVLIIPLAMLPWALADRRIRFLVLCGAVFLFGLCLNAWFFPHYAAPATAIVYAVLIQCMRHLRAWRPAMANMIPALCILLVVIRLLAGPLNLTISRWPSMWYGTEGLGLPRWRIASELHARPGRHLAIVRYAPAHNPVDDWVYNEPDIDASRIAWAREMSPEENAKLMAYFGDRAVWLVEPDAMPPRISRQSAPYGRGSVTVSEPRPQEAVALR
ncbi:MAG: hypothetical protein WD696_01125 [Bryobacteraceae bacterium]